jgi:hypothetical protein
MWLLKLAWGYLSGGGLTGILSTLTGVYDKYKDSAVESERLQATWAAQQLATMEHVRLATAGFWEMRLLTFCIGATFTLHLMLVGLDTMFLWTWNGLPVRAFPKPMNEWEGAILLSFFGLTAGVVGIKAVASAILSRR